MMTQSGTVEPGAEELQAFRSRRRVQVPEEVREGAPVPETWPYGRESWAALAEAARQHLKIKAEHDFAFAIAVRGFYPDELASGRLAPGAQVNTVTGKVIRPMKPSITPATEDRARRALKRLAERNLKLDPVLQQTLERAAWGCYLGHPKSADAAIAAAEGATNRIDAERQAAASEQAARPVLTVHRPFRAIGGKSYAPGTFRIDQAEADQLRLWQERMEAQAKGRDWDAPAGFQPETWPPFALARPTFDE